ncbi:exopolysaccharide biosynthesis protein [Legionella jordanis]|uniref:Proton transporter n=1 Tax=Legionella jordanis TaxID=456 RepID=A0A0W0VFY5_9GAMM|nr:exopolysaccharide biosynthesis protein [Legionella jordanis]KTD19007.1 proton transporter [Legionella jordanis]RMX05432.1 exopolysaccharide biosynthesis protein [Legionella jordanis]RMX19115.1 exopolysaccharide biosynthesis protein [Legionella jordanis]VEH13109.1 ABC transporter permease [Legionella jordanis]HAT8714770.1 exopolysaccharide biosynthesis protein [Legionella jordanis]
MHQSSRRSSDVLSEMVHHDFKTGMTYQGLLDKLGERAFGIALLLFALPSALPFSAVPGISFIFSLPIAIFACQMILARNTLWLPKFVARKQVPCDRLGKVIEKALPYLKKVEHLSKPRWAFMSIRAMDIITGLLILLLSILLMLPIPLSNFIISSLIIVFSLGFIEKDGVFIAIGYVSTLTYLLLMYWLFWASIRAIVGL